MKLKTQRVLLLTFLFSFFLMKAQNEMVKGKVFNANNGEAMPFTTLNIYFPNEKKSVDTDFDGFFQVSTSILPDSIVVEKEGFAKRKLKINDFSTLEIVLNPQISQEKKNKNEAREKNIEGVVIKKKKKKYSNPAYEILEKFVERKPLNNPDKYQSYHYEKYSRMEISMSDFGEKIKKRKVYKDIQNLLEKDKDSATDNPKTMIIPIFVSENLSDIYFQKNPEKESEIIKKTKTDGIGIDDGTMFSQLMTSTFINYNFYNNYIRILGKDFISPVNDNFKIQYDYELVNKQAEVNGEKYYLLNFKPTRESDLAFSGSVYIAHGSYALYRIDATISPNANLNFIHSLRIQQEMTKLEANDQWFPGKTRVFLETAKPGKESLAVFLKYYASTKNIETEIAIDPTKFDKKINLLADAENSDNSYWETNRHDPLGKSEQKMLDNIGNIKKLPSVRSYIDILDMLINGYYKVGSVGLGPILYTVGYNDYEGFRVRAGFQTNKFFSKKWTLGGYTSYGFRDQAMKFGGKVDYIFSREPWIQAGISYSHDLGQVAFQFEDFSMRRNNLFDSFTKNGKMTMRKPFWQDTYQAYFQADLSRTLTEKISLKHYNFDPLFPYAFIEDTNLPVMDNFKTTEIIAETSWKPGRVLLESGNNKQVALKDNVYNPTITFRYTKGVKSVFGSDFSYNKLHLNIQQIIPMGLLGRGEYSLTGGWIPDKVPYPLLENHLGNNFGFYNKYAFNMMRFFEFTSNKFVSVQYIQNLEGLITNSLPIIKKWNWRNHVTFNYLLGDLDPSFVNNSYLKGEDFRSLNNKPYMEIGYGVSNIFRFLRVDFIHRLSHLESVIDGKPAPKFSVKVSAQIRL